MRKNLAEREKVTILHTEKLIINSKKRNAYRKILLFEHYILVKKGEEYERTSFK